MAGLLDIFGGSPQAQGLLAATAQILQASGPSFRPTSLGQILGGGLQAGQEATQLARARDLQFRGAEADLAAQERARAMQEQELAAARRAIRTPGQQAAALPGGPTQENAARIGEFKSEFDPDAYVAAMMQINPLRALEIKRSLAKSGPEFDTKPQVATDDMGNVFQYLVAKDGSIRKLDGVKPRDEMKLATFGGRTEAYDPYALRAGQTFQHTMAPGEAASNAVARANLGLSRERLELDRLAMGPGGAKAPAGYRWKADGSLEAITGGPATKGATATEGERKAATLLMRLQGSEAQLEEALKDDAGAATPNLLAQGLRGVGAESAANSILGEGRQRVEAAQLDILDAALTLGTGAAYTREQLEGYRRSYFPQIGDSKKTVEEKQARLNNVIDAARVAAGRAAPGGDPLPPPQRNPGAAYSDPEKERRYQEWKRSQGK
jgi:hypothetical protein